MEGWIVLVVLAVIGWWLYKVGKRTGSRKGYHVGGPDPAVGAVSLTDTMWIARAVPFTGNGAGDHS